MITGILTYFMFCFRRLLRTMREIFVYLSHLGMRLRHPSDWGSVSFQTIDCTASSFVFGYALYLSCISLRRNATRSPREVFESTHTVILSALMQSEALCARVFPVEMTYKLKKGILEESHLARDGMSVHPILFLFSSFIYQFPGLLLVHSFNELDDHAHAMTVLQPASGPLAALRTMIHTSLLKIEAVHKSYTA